MILKEVDNICEACERLDAGGLEFDQRRRFGQLQLGLFARALKIFRQVRRDNVEIMNYLALDMLSCLFYLAVER